MATTMRGLDEQKSGLMFIEMTPPHGWKEDSDFHYLQLTLPGFEAKDIHLRVNKYGHLVVRGDKQVSEHKYITFEETFDVPNGADLENADGLFKEDQIYCVAIPKIKGGKRSTAGPAITIPHHEVDNNSPKPRDSIIHQHDSTKNKPINNPLQVIREDKSKKKLKIAFFIAALIAFLVVGVALIVKFHR